MSTATVIELRPTRTTWATSSMSSPMDGLVKFDSVRGCHDDALARVPRGRDECRLAHQAQRMAAEQRAVVIGLLRKHHLHEPGFVGMEVWRRR